MAVATIAAAITTLAGCGDSSGTEKDQLLVSGASSLTDAFTAYGKDFGAADVKLSFAGSDELAAQIRAGAGPDVYAAANTDLPDQLNADGLAGKPVVFASNRLVLAVPPSSEIRSVADLARPGTKLAIGSPSVPIGSYTRTVLSRLDAPERDAILSKVRSEEPDVAGIIGKLTQGAVDAGFVYATDVEATGGRVKAIRLPARLQPSVAYGAAVITGASHPEEAAQFIDGLVSGQGAVALRKAGFEAPPG